MGKSESQGYVTPYKPVPLDENYPENFNARLVRTQSDLKELVSDLRTHKIIAIDTETNSTDWGYGHIVGMSTSTDRNSGWYIPFRHEDYDRNLPLGLLPKLFEIVKDKQILMYNALFDETMLDKEGWECDKLKILDVMGLAYLMDTNIHLPSLKDTELLFLGRKAPTFEETLKGREHFGYIPPEEAVLYASTDTGSTFGLFEELYPRVHKEAPKALKLDNAFVPVLRKLCNTQLPVRLEILPSLEKYYEDEIKIREKKIFEAVGYPFNIKSNKQLEMAFKQLGIKTGYTTDKGNMSLKAEILELIQDKYPFVGDIVKYKSMSSTLSALKKFRGENVIRCNYEMYNTVTGRMSSGSAKDSNKLALPKEVKPFFSKFNAQNFLKSKEIYYKGIYKPEDPYSILGYRFKPIKKEDIQPDDLIVEAMDYKGNPRRLINCVQLDNDGNVIADEKTHYWVKGDYAGAELRLACIFSKEPVLMEAFLHGVDPHTNTAKNMFGVTDKAHRKKAKTCIGDNTLIQTNHGWKYPKDLIYNYDKLIDEKNNLINWNMCTEQSNDMYHVQWSNGVIEDLHIDHKVGVWTGKEIEQVPLRDITLDMQVVCLRNVNFLKTPKYKSSICSSGLTDVCESFIGMTPVDFNMYPIHLINKEQYTGTKYAIEVNTDTHLYKGLEIHSNCNFSNLYEGSSMSLARASGLPQEEADELWHKYWNTMRGLRGWMNSEQRKANISCVCRTFMGRPRRLQWYFRHPKLSMRSFAKRSVISHTIQGSLGDIIKLTLIRSHKEIFNNLEWTRNHDAVFYMTIHDEIDAGVRKERVFEYLDTLSALGKIQLPDWEFPLELDFDLGYSYGFVVGITKDKDTGDWKVKFKKGSDIIG